MPSSALHLVIDHTPESESEISGVYSGVSSDRRKLAPVAQANEALVTTAKIPKVQLDRLRKIKDERDAAIAARETLDELPHDEAPTIQAQVPDLPLDLPLPIEPEPISGPISNDLVLVEEPAAAPEHTVVMRYPTGQYQTVPQLPIVVAPSFVPIVGAPMMVAPAAIEAARVARETARQAEQARTRTKWLVVAIWATAFALAGGLAWVVSHDHTSSPQPVVTE